ncbi:hypothetical protein [Helicobacter fennelliae]|mgnify:FL=1|uniref:Uncharacterized protein n=2 Tax=Helicobacter fennelliae TaxID=215 RepID=T1D2Z9_9HELI|nr:hypothetical protein [Helicobacter fennelliae]GAD19566.1 hypothetical protein HFN_0806 [Helicobacter fennelliae MRY12-0050]SQB98503.1 membrane protein [Helicobacter fennelliae]STP07867.1 membrane protein [Helicobacter fennelliae]STQ84249.1 membrane protein [Helicobacter fennelliae]
MLELISITGIFLLLGAFIFVILHNLSIAKIKKIFIGGVLYICLFAMMFYIYKQNNTQSTTAFLQKAFLEGQTLDCEGFLVNQTDFNFINQTYMLIGKPNTPTSNIMISLDKCKIVVPDINPDQTINGHTLEELQRD